MSISVINGRTVTAVLASILATAILVGCESGPSADENYQQGWESYKKGELRTAIVHLKNALTAKPDFAEARELLGRTYVQLGLGELAEKELLRAAKLGYSGAEYEDILMRALLLQRRYDDVLQQLKSGWKTIDPVVAMTAGGVAELGRENLERAEKLFRKALEIEPDNVDARRSLVTIMVLKGDVDTGKAELERLIEIAPQDQRSWLLKASIAEREDNLDEALDAYRKVAEINSDSATARIGLARIHLRREQPDEALAELKRVSDAGTRTPWSYHLRGVALLQKGDDRTARGNFADALKLEPEFPPSLYTLGLIEYRAGNFLTAQEYLRRYAVAAPRAVDGKILLAAVYMQLGEFLAARTVLNEAATLEPDRAEIMAMLGTAQSRSGDAAAAARSFERAVALDPDVAAYRLQLGQQYLESGDSKRAIEALKAAQQQDANLIAAGYLIGFAELKAGDVDKALEQARSLTEKDPDDALGWQLLGLVRSKQGDQTAARKSFETAMSLQPGLIVSALQLARLDQSAGDIEGARQRLTEVLENPKLQLPSEDVVLLRRQLARIALASGELTAARNEYQKILEIDDSDVEALLSVAQLPASDAGTSDRIALLEKARKRDPKSLTARNFLAAYYLALHRYDEARTVAQEAVALAPSNSIALTLLGRAQGASGRYGEAVQTFKRAAEAAAGRAAPLIEYGRWAVLNGDTEAAAAAFLEATRIEPENLDAAVARASLEAVKGDPEIALALARELQSNYPESPHGFNIEADILAARGEHDQAVKLLQHAMTLAPNSTQLGSLYDALRAAGRTSEADATLEQTLREHPDDDRMRALVAAIYSVQNRHADAVRHLAALAARHPNDASVLNELAWSRLQLGLVDEAETAAKKAFQLAPDDAQILDTYGWVLVKSGQLEQALTAISRAAAQASDNGSIRFHQAYVLWKLGQREKALNEVQAALAVTAPFRERAEAERLEATLLAP